MGWEKPDPRNYADCLSALGVVPERAIHVGDSFQSDCRGAEAAGLAGAVLMLNGKEAPSEHSGATIHHLSNLLGLLGIG